MDVLPLTAPALQLIPYRLAFKVCLTGSELPLLSFFVHFLFLASAVALHHLSASNFLTLFIFFIVGEAGSIMYDCSDLSNPSRTDFTSVDCSGAGTTTSNLNQSCTFNSGNSLWATSGCVADLSALFVGNAVSLNGYNNATDCPANGPVVSYTVSTASSACAPISGAGNVVATTYDCNSTYINVLYCFDTSCSNCVVQMSTPGSSALQFQASLLR
jgi:hypothetical protein